MNQKFNFYSNLWKSILNMEYRLHSSSSVNLSALGINLSSFQVNSNEKDKKFVNVLRTACKQGINFFHLTQDTLNPFFLWYQEYNISSKTNFDFFTSLELKFSDNLYHKLENILEMKLISKLDLVSISEVNHHSTEISNVLNDLKKLKEQGLIKSIGLRSHGINEAIICLKKFDLDHFVAPISLLTSPDLLKSLLTICENKNVSLIAINPVNDEFYDFKENYSISSLLIEGMEKTNLQLHELAQSLNITKHQLALRYLLDLNLTSILIRATSLEHINETVKPLRLPPFSSSQLQTIFSAIDFTTYYPSPKRGVDHF